MVTNVTKKVVTGTNYVDFQVENEFQIRLGTVQVRKRTRFVSQVKLSIDIIPRFDHGECPHDRWQSAEREHRQICRRTRRRPETQAARNSDCRVRGILNF